MAIHRSTDADGLTVTFVLITEEFVAPVSVVGSFNDWTPGAHAFADNPDGSRSVTIVVPIETDVHFRYLGPDGYWFDDPEADEITPEGSVLRAPAVETPADQDVLDEEPADQAPVDEAPTADTPVDEAVDEGSAVSPADTSAEESLAAEASSPHVSADATPVDDAPADEAPAAGGPSSGEAPAAVAGGAESAEPVEESPVDEPSVDGPASDEAPDDDHEAAPAPDPAHDETGERLKAVSEQIDTAKETARDLVDRDIIEARPGHEPGRAFVDEGQGSAPA